MVFGALVNFFFECYEGRVESELEDCIDFFSGFEFVFLECFCVPGV